MTKIQKQLIEELKSNHCNITAACETCGVKLAQFKTYLEKNDQFKTGYNEAKQAADDFAKEKFFDLLEDGDKTAAIEYQRLKIKELGEGELKRIRREVMSVFIDNFDTKAKCVAKFSQIFNATASKSADFFKKIIAEEGKESPAQRIKRQKAAASESMAELLEAGKLGEIEMYTKMLSIALYDSQNSEFPSERSRAMDKVIAINQRLEEVQERKRREAEQDNENLFDKLDAVLAGVSPADIKAVRIQILNEKQIEGA